jgi:small subunit ribosomal protein S6
VRDYELMVVLDPNLDEAAVEAVNQRLTTLVTQRGGRVDQVDAWGRRRLAYPIARHRDGIYVLTRLTIDPDVAAEIERMLKLNESVIRHLLVRYQPPAPGAAPVAAAAPSALAEE